jgi:UDP-N-acetyl-D-mannosaminuronate dehydrogenase
MILYFLESTVYPGIRQNFKKKYFSKKQLIFGYSPERINPGDKKIR